MSAELSLNQVVKGTPPSGLRAPEPLPLPPLGPASSETIEAIISDPHNIVSEPKTMRQSTEGAARSSQNIVLERPSRERLHLLSPTASHSDPTILSNLPSSPPQIYLNLLILESSLRAQHLALLTRRRLNTFFLIVLAAWITTFTYLLLLRPREDDPTHTRLGGSPYWVVEAGIKVGWLAGIMTAALMYATGQWEKGMRWPRKWLSHTNRGLRGFNLRVVPMRKSIWKEVINYILTIISSGSLAEGRGDWHLVESSIVPLQQSQFVTDESQPTTPISSTKIVEEDLSASGDHLLLLLLPKNFSSEFRENWEVYRSEYWARENLRRANLRKKVRLHQRHRAKETGGWKWWTGLWRIVPHASHKRQHDLEKHPHGHVHHRSASQARQASIRQTLLNEKDLLHKGRRRSMMRSDSAHSRNSSRSSTPHVMLDGTYEIRGNEATERVRRGSSVSSTSSARRSLKSATTSTRRGDGGMLSPLTSADDGVELPPKERRKRRSRPTTPTMDSSESLTDGK